MTAPGEIVYFDGRFVAQAEAKVPITTHAFNYGTGCFEGIRAYWSPRQERLNVVRLPEHAERLLRSAHILHLEPPPGLTVERVGEIVVDLLARNEYREDVYVRPILYKSGATIKVTLSGISSDLCIYTLPFGDYLDIRSGLRVMISAWRRIDDNSIPSRAKPTGAYLNAALASDEARARGFDEAIMLTGDGHVSEASSSNLFLVEQGVLVTPQATDDVLVGITRDCVLALARERGLQVEVRRVDRSELLAADEAFLAGTGVQIAPVTEVDGRTIGGGGLGPVTRELQDAYLKVVRGETDEWQEWLTPVGAPETAGAGRD